MTAWTPWPWHLARWALLLVSGCWVVSDFDVHACDGDEQCDIPVGALRYCEGGRCVVGCRNNRHCASVDPQFPICSKAGTACVSITSAEGECHVSSEYDDARQGEQTAESMTIVGAFASTLRSSTWLTLDLAVRELRQQPTAGSELLAAPLVVLCDDSTDAITGGMAHLVGQLGVRAVVASFDGARRAAALAGGAESVLELSPDGRWGAATNASHWHLGGDYASLLPAYRLLVQGLARRVDERSTGTDRPARVAVLAGEGDDAMLADLVSTDLSIGEMPRGELERHDRFRTISLTDVGRAEAVASLLELAPDLVVVQAGGVFSTPPRDERAAVVARLEEAVATSGRPLPLYVIGPRRAGDTSLDLLAAKNPSFRARAVVVTLQLPGGRESDLRERFAALYPHRGMPSAYEAAPGIYDALYHLVYAAAAGRGEQSALSAASLREGLLRVTGEDGPEVPVGAAGLELGRELLESRRPFRLLGITGAGAFDAEQQLRPSTPRIACWSGDGALATIGTPSNDGTSLEISSGICGGEAVDGLFE